MPTLGGVFRSIASIPGDDGIVFDPGSVAGKDAGYGGVRIDLRATLDGARLSLQNDSGFGDTVTPAAQSIAYPILLLDVPAPTLRAYPKATVVAEKLHSVSVMDKTNPRMKDFFDLALLLRDDTLDDAACDVKVGACASGRVRHLALENDPAPLPHDLTSEGRPLAGSSHHAMESQRTDQFPRKTQ